MIAVTISRSTLKIKESWAEAMNTMVMIIVQIHCMAIGAMGKRILLADHLIFLLMIICIVEAFW